MIPPALSHVLASHPDILSGTPCFVGTRVPVRMLLEYLEHGVPLEEFCHNFSTVPRAHVLAVVQYLTGQFRQNTAMGAMA